MSIFFPFQGAKTETEILREQVAENAYRYMDNKTALTFEVTKFLNSDKRKWMVDGDLYYRGEQDILNQGRTAIGDNGQLRPLENLPDYRIVDNQYAKLVDQKANYQLGKPFSVESENDRYQEELTKVFNRRFNKTLKETLVEAMNGGVGWIYTYYNDRGELSFKTFPAHEIIPFYDDEEGFLKGVLRVYKTLEYEGGTEVTVKRVEHYSRDGIDHYIYDGIVLIDDVERERRAYIQVERETEEGIIREEYNWDRVPFIPFKFNALEIPLIKRTKSLQDAINKLISMFQNNMLEDARNTILILKNYDGQNLAEFRQNLNAYGIVKLRSTPGVEGGLESLNVEVNSGNYEALLKTLKKALIENGRGFDAKDDRMSSNPNQMNIQSMYADIELDANGIETEFQASFEDLLWFVNQHLKNMGLGDFDGEQVNIVFNRDMLSNEKEIVETLVASMGMLSMETLIAQHPYVVDPQLEMERKLSEENRLLESTNPYAGTFEETVV